MPNSSIGGANTSNGSFSGVGENGFCVKKTNSLLWFQFFSYFCKEI